MMNSLNLHILCYNEEYLLPSVLEYYSKHVDSITVYDNHSTDDSVAIAKGFGATVIPFGKVGTLDDRGYLEIKNAKRRGWNIVCDADELLYHPAGLRKMAEIEAQLGATFLDVKGFNIYSKKGLSEVDNLLDIDTGYFYEPFDKKICFNGSKLRPNYFYGAHHWKPKGTVKSSKTKFYLLHYRCIGGVQRMIDRHAEYKSRMSSYNIAKKLGVHYLRSESDIRKEWDMNIHRSKCFHFL